MPSKEDLESLRSAILEVPDDQVVKTPRIPRSEYFQEAEDLVAWAGKDRSELRKAGLEMELLESLQTRAGAARETQSRWNAERFSQKEAQKIYSAKVVIGVDLRDALVHHCRYAFRKNSELGAKVAAIAEGYSQADMIQDLNDLAVLGRENRELFRSVGASTELLDQAAELSKELARLGAEAHGDTDRAREIKVMRDKSFTYLKQAVDEIRECGRYVFWKDAKRFNGYTSLYLRKRRNKKSGANEAQPSTVEEALHDCPYLPENGDNG